MKVVDYKGNELKVGTQVLFGSPGKDEDPEEYKGTIKDISDPDVVYNPVTDADDGGYAVTITVKMYISGDIEKVSARYMGRADIYDEDVWEENGDLEVI